MKNIRKLVAALLVLSMVLALTGTAFAAAKFTKADKGVYVKFTGNMYAYNKPSHSSKSKILVRKGSTALITNVSANQKWVRLKITPDVTEYDEKKDEDVVLSAGKEMWFGVDRLSRVTSERHESIHVTFSSGGSSLSKEEERAYDPRLKKVGKVKITGKVNLRKKASLQGKSQGTVKKGTKLTLTGVLGMDTRGVIFFQVKVKNRSGKYFVSEEYTNLKGKFAIGE